MNWLPWLGTPLPGEAINPQTFVYERDILAEAQVSLKNAWRPMEADGGQIFYYKSAVCLQNTLWPVAPNPLKVQKI